MTEADIVSYMGYCLAAFALGWYSGFKILAIKKFVDQI